MRSAENNFEILLRDASGKAVPGSIRTGHNVMTLDGIDLLARLIAWDTVSSADAAFTQRRARYVGVGGGAQIEDKGAVSLIAPLQVTAGVYLKALAPVLSVFTTFTSVAVKAVLLPAEITYALPSVVVSEAGLYFDCSPGGALSVSSSTNVPAFYKTFEPLVKLNSFSMEITWDLSF